MSNIPPNEAWGVTRAKINNKVDKNGEGINFVTVQITDNAITNGTNLLSAVATVQSMDDGKRVLYLPNGTYDIQSVTLLIDVENVSIIGEPSNPELVTIIGTTQRTTFEDELATIFQNADGLVLSGLTIRNDSVITSGHGNYAFGTDAELYPNTLVKNCNFIALLSTMSMGLGRGSYHGIWQDCVIESSPIYSSPVVDSNIYGSFDHMVVSGRGALSAPYGILYGRVTNSIGGTCFLAGTIASTAIVRGCIGGESSFAGGNGSGVIEAGGVVTNCRGAESSFGYNKMDGECVSSSATGQFNFFGNTSFTGLCVDCYTADGHGSFGALASPMTGTLIGCRLGVGTYTTPGAGGIIRNSFLPDWTEVNEG